MEPGNSEFMSDAESKKILQGRKEEIKKTIEERNPGKYALKSLIREEKKGDRRQDVLSILKNRLSEEKVLDRLNNLSHQLLETEDLLDKISTGKQTERIESSEIVDKTVKQLRKYLKQNEISKDQLQELLKEEEKGKDRKTAKQYINKELESADSDSNLEKLQEDLSELENDISSFRTEISENRDKFNLPENDDKKQNKDSKTEENQKELLEATSKVIERLKERDDLRNNEELKNLVNDAFLALEAENYPTFKDKLHEIKTLEENDNSEDNDLSEQENKLERMESMVSKLEERQKESLGVPQKTTEEVNEQLDTLEEISGQEIERPGKKKREQKIDELSSKGFNEEDLKTRSDSDLERLEKSSEDIDNLESKFEQLDKDQSETDKNSEIEENIEKLEESLNSDKEESSSSLDKFEKKIKKSKDSKKKGILGLI